VAGTHNTDLRLLTSQGSALILACGSRLAEDGYQVVALGSPLILACGSRLAGDGDQVVAPGSALIFACGSKLTADGDRVVAPGSALILACGSKLTADGDRVVALGSSKRLETWKRLHYVLISAQSHCPEHPAIKRNAITRRAHGHGAVYVDILS
jgi:hypothetical protein